MMILIRSLYEIWLRYNEYRSRTFLTEPYSCLVVADITNYFDSIQHDLLIEYLAPLGLPRKAMGVQCLRSQNLIEIQVPATL